MCSDVYDQLHLSENEKHEAKTHRYNIDITYTNCGSFMYIALGYFQQFLCCDNPIVTWLNVIQIKTEIRSPVGPLVFSTS